jgi:hypothetical protein
VDEANYLHRRLLRARRQRPRGRRALPRSAMKLRRLMQIARRGQSLPKGSVVRHSKIGPPMTLWVIRARSIYHRRSRHVRFAPKADKQADISLSPLGAKSGLMLRE